MTLAALAREIEYPVQTMRTWINGSHAPHEPTRRKAEKALRGALLAAGAGGRPDMDAAYGVTASVTEPAAEYRSRRAIFPVRADGEVEGWGKITLTVWIEILSDDGGV